MGPTPGAAGAPWPSYGTVAGSSPATATATMPTSPHGPIASPAPQGDAGYGLNPAMPAHAASSAGHPASGPSAAPAPQAEAAPAEPKAPREPSKIGLFFADLLDGIKALGDLSFTKPTTPRLKKLVAVLPIPIAVVLWLGTALVLLLLAITFGRMDGVFGAVLGLVAVFTLIFGWIPGLLGIALVRMLLESSWFGDNREEPKDAAAAAEESDAEDSEESPEGKSEDDSTEDSDEKASDDTKDSAVEVDSATVKDFAEKPKGDVHTDSADSVGEKESEFSPDESLKGETDEQKADGNNETPDSRKDDLSS